MKNNFSLYRILWAVLSIPVFALLFLSGMVQQPSWLMKAYFLLLLLTLISFPLGYLVGEYRPPVTSKTLRFFSVTLPASLSLVLTLVTFFTLLFID